MLQCLAAIRAGQNLAIENSSTELRALVESSDTAAWLKLVLPMP
jgi:hypothetical protein